MTIKERVLKTVETVIDSQNKKGLKKYGQTLDECDPNSYDWQQMIIEELIDALQYQQKELKKQAERVQELEEERDEWKDTSQSYYMTNQELRERNKRYREAIVRAKTLLVNIGNDTSSKMSAISILTKAMEGEE